MLSKKINLRTRRQGSKRSISYVVPLVIVIVLVIAFAAGYLAGTSSSTATSTVSSTVTTTAQIENNPSCVTLHTCSSSYIYIANGASQQSYAPGFTPDAITVVIGINNSVTWQNLDTVSQTVVGANNLFTSPSLIPGATFSYTFTTPGTYTYSSPTYSWEKGTVTVVQSTASTSAVGSNPDDNY